MNDPRAPRAPSLLEPFEDRVDILFRELELAAKWERPSILLAVYSSEYVHGDAEASLEKHLAGLGQKVVRFQIRGDETADVARSISQAGAPQATVFFVDGLRWGGRRDGFNAYKSLNLCRDYFVNNRIRVVFWLTEGEAVDLAHYAPDYWAFRHRVVEFVEAPEPEQVLTRSLESAWQAAGRNEEDPEDMDAKISLRSALLSGLPEGDESESVRADLSLTLGMLHWRKGEHQKAADFMQTALQIARRIENTWLEAVCFNAIALVQANLGRADEAIEAFERAAKLAPDQIFPWNNLGNLYNRLDRNEEAMAAFQKALQHNPRDTVSWNGLGNVCLELGRIADAAGAYRKAIELVPDYAAPWNGLGNACVRSGQLDEAIVSYQKAIGCERNFLEPWINLGNLFKAQGRNRDAIKAYREAVEIDPDNVQVWNELGNAYFAAGDQDEAVKAYARLSQAIEARRGEQNSVEAAADLVEAHMRDYNSALEAFHAVDALGAGQPVSEPAPSAVETQTPAPDETQPHRPVALNDAAPVEPGPEVQSVVEPEPVLAESAPEAVGAEVAPKSMEPEAVEPEPAPKAVAGPVADETAAVPPPVEVVAEPHVEIPGETENACVWNELGNLYYNAGAYEQAAHAYGKAIAMNAGFGWPYSNLALAYSNLGRHAEAIPLYQKSLDLLGNDKDKAVTWDRLGDAYRRLNDYDNAIAAYQMADELKPAAAPLGSELREVLLDQIERNPRQPRAEVEVEELTESVREHGILQPLIVTPAGTAGKYVLIAGERRLEAARQAGLGKVPVIVREATDQQRLELALIENVQRSDLNALELAEAYRQLAEEFELSHEAIAARVGKSRAAVSNTLRLLKLSQDVKKALMGKRIGEGHARALLRLPTEQLQDAALEYVLKNELSVRQVEELVRELQGETLTPRPARDLARSAHQPASTAQPETDDQDRISLLTRARFMLLGDRHAERNSHFMLYRSGG